MRAYNSLTHRALLPLAYRRYRLTKPIWHAHIAQAGSRYGSQPPDSPAWPGTWWVELLARRDANHTGACPVFLQDNPGTLCEGSCPGQTTGRPTGDAPSRAKENEMHPEDSWICGGNNPYLVSLFTSIRGPSHSKSAGVSACSTSEVAFVWPCRWARN